MSLSTTRLWALMSISVSTVSRSSRSSRPRASRRSVVMRVATAGAKIREVLPLCRMARANRPFAAGVARRAPIENAPADSPATVTLSGAPPKAAMLPVTHRRAAV
jgi:hypothetical protein